MAGKLNTAPVGAAACGFSALLLLACGNGIPVVHEILPTPTATATPSGPRTPEPVGAVACDIGDGSDAAECRRDLSKHFDTVQSAIDAVIKAYPEIFEWDAAANQYLILDKPAFLAGVLDALRAAGFCADLDYTDLKYIDLKNSADFSEQFDLITDTGHIRRGGLAYRTTCTPASFPVVPAPDAPPPGSGCGKPYPPPIADFAAKIHVRGPEYWTLDSTPRVHDRAYCALIGYTDNRSVCAVRPHEADDREACENWAVGTTDDTGLPGPTWTRDGEYCTGPDSGCAHHPESPYLLLVYWNGTGSYNVCADNGVCAELFVQR